MLIGRSQAVLHSDGEQSSDILLVWCRMRLWNEEKRSVCGGAHLLSTPSTRRPSCQTLSSAPDLLTFSIRVWNELQVEEKPTKHDPASLGKRTKLPFLIFFFLILFK